MRGADGREALAAETVRLARPRLLDWIELTKPRVTSMVLLTTAAGFYMGSVGPLDLALLLHALFGTALAAAGASALNQYMERDGDGRMARTCARPLPSGRMEPAQALVFGCLLSAAGLLHLAVAVNRAAAGLVALTLLSYLFAYTPMKRKSAFCTLVGALPGALPPLIGWAAAEGGVSSGGLALFAILFVWQLPHALAIACLYREDYARGGFVLLPNVTGAAATGRVALAHAVVLLPLSLLPAVSGIAGPVYALGAVLLGVLFALSTVPLARRGSARAARRVLLVSVAYLPALLLLMALDRRVPLL